MMNETLIVRFVKKETEGSYLAVCRLTPTGMKILNAYEGEEAEKIYEGLSKEEEDDQDTNEG